MSYDKRDMFYKATGANNAPVVSIPQSSGNLSGAVFVAVLSASSAFCGMVTGYALHEGKPPQVITRPEKVWRFVERCSEKAPQPDTRRFLPDTIPRTNPGAVDLLHAPDYVGKHGRTRHYEPKGYSRGHPRNSQSGTSVGGVTSR